MNGSRARYDPVELERLSTHRLISHDRRPQSFDTTPGTRRHGNGVILTVILIIILRQYDGKPPPLFGSAFGSALTLNTIVAIIITASKAALLLPVAECVGQLKWEWFAKRERPLNDLATFDKASRGLIGGFALLWRTKVATFACTGAVLLIFAITIDSLSQQLVSYATTQIVSPNQNATLPTIQVWADASGSTGMIISSSGQNSGQDNDSIAAGSISTGMKGAIQTGLYSANETVLDLSPICPGGNCTFDAYSSLAVCTSFADVSAHLTLKNATITSAESGDASQREYHLTPNNYLNLGSNELMNISTAASENDHSQTSNPGLELLNFNNSIAFRNVNTPIADIFLIVANSTDSELPHSFVAVEILFQWCVQTFTTKSLNGTASTHRTNNRTGFEAPGGASYVTLRLNDTNQNPEYAIAPDTHSSLQHYFRSLFKGSVSNRGGSWYATSDVAQTLFEPFNIWQFHDSRKPWNLSEGISGTNQTGLEAISKNIATGMTNYMRRAASPTSAQGTVWIQANTVHIRWKWIVPQSIFAMVSVLFLLVTAILHRSGSLRHDTWKTDSLAVVYALDPKLQRRLGGAGGATESGADAAEMVRLVRVDGDGWRLCEVEHRTGPVGG